MTLPLTWKQRQSYSTVRRLDGPGADHSDFNTENGTFHHPCGRSVWSFLLGPSSRGDSTVTWCSSSVVAFRGKGRYQWRFCVFIFLSTVLWRAGIGLRFPPQLELELALSCQIRLLIPPRLYLVDVLDCSARCCLTPPQPCERPAFINWGYPAETERENEYFEYSKGCKMCILPLLGAIKCSWIHPVSCVGQGGATAFKSVSQHGVTHKHITAEVLRISLSALLLKKNVPG